jgi:DNA polymerase III subunit delta
VLGLRGSTFPARKALSQVKNLGSGGIRRAIGLLADADIDLRGAQAWPEDLVMEVLVARLTRLSRVRG